MLLFFFGPVGLFGFLYLEGEREKERRLVRLLAEARFLGIESDYVWFTVIMLSFCLCTFFGHVWGAYYDKQGPLYAWIHHKDEGYPRNIRTRYVGIAITLGALIAGGIAWTNETHKDNMLARKREREREELLDKLVSKLTDKTTHCKVGEIGSKEDFKPKIFLPHYKGRHPKDATFSANVEEISTIVLSQREDVEVGKYTNGGPAYRTDFHACLVGVHTLKVMRFKLELDPPDVIQVPVGSTSGADGDTFLDEALMHAVEHLLYGLPLTNSRAHIYPWTVEKH